MMCDDCYSEYQQHKEYCFENNMCQHCHADLDLYAVGDIEEQYCEVCGNYI